MDEVDALPGISMDVPDRQKVSGVPRRKNSLSWVETNGTILFRNQTNDPFVSFTRDGPQETLPIGSSDFKIGFKNATMTRPESLLKRTPSHR